jgi:hypothetical protein
MLRTVFGLALLLALVGLLAAATGCPRTPPPAPPPVTPTVPAPGTPGAGTAPGVPPTTVTPALPTGELGEIVAAYNKVTSYEVATTTGGKAGLKAAVKVDQGKPAAMRVKVPQGYALVLMGEQAMYLLDAKTKTAAKLSFGKKAQDYANKLPSPTALAAKQPTVTTAKLGAVDCWLLEWTDNKGEKVQMWLDKQYGLPQQSQHGTVVTKFAYTNINKVPDSTFEVPQGYKVKEMKVEAPKGTGGTGAMEKLPGPPPAPNKPASKKPASNKSGSAKQPAAAPGLTPGP